MARPSRQAASTKQLPALDVSWEAYKALLACVLVQGVLEGISLCFGIFQNHYDHEQLPGYENASWIGDTALGMLYTGAPLMTYLCEARKMKPEYFVYAAWACCVLSLVTAAFCKTIPTLAVTQGALLGIGSLLVEIPGLMILNSWFVERRGFAYGVAFAFMDVFGAAWGYLAHYTLGLHGLTFTLLVFAAVAAVIPAFAISSFKRRPTTSGQDVAERPSTLDSLTESPESSPEPRPDRHFLRHPLFYVFVITTCAQSLAYYVPSIYLPTYNTQVLSSITDSTSANTNLLAAFNLAQIPGEFVFGYLSDHGCIHLLSLVSSSVAGIATLLLWAGLAGHIGATFGSLLAFAALFGAFGAGFITLWGRMSMSFGRRNQTVYSIFSFARGVSTLASAPISSALLRLGTRLQKEIPGQSGHRGVESQYKVLILFVAWCMIAAAVVAGLGRVVESVDKRMGEGKGGDEHSDDDEEWFGTEVVKSHIVGGTCITEKEGGELAMP